MLPSAVRAMRVWAQRCRSADRRSAGAFGRRARARVAVLLLVSGTDSIPVIMPVLRLYL